ncbi:DUF6398 domain-containing protein [Isosphaeraceae bacterium EP7]
MLLCLEDAEQFFRIHKSLMLFVGRRLNLIDCKYASPKSFEKLPPSQRLKVHEALLDHMDLIDAFADENPQRLVEDDIEIARSWTNLVSGEFFAFRQLKQEMIFLSADEPVLAYGVLALFDPFEVVIGPDLPRLIRTTLVPFKGKIIYDGLAIVHDISFGGGVKRILDETYKEAKARNEIIRSLPHHAKGTEAARKNDVSGKRTPVAASSAARPAHDRIVALIDAFCREELDEEYAELCRKLAGILVRKRPSPLVRGKPESWASGIVRVIGWVNFLGDPSQPHHMKMTDIDRAFGVSEATGSAKSMEIRNQHGIDRIDPEWMLKSRMEQNPLVWMIRVNGMIDDARDLPRKVQEEAFRKGLIPFIPDPRAGRTAED